MPTFYSKYTLSIEEFNKIVKIKVIKVIIDRSEIDCEYVFPILQTYYQDANFRSKNDIDETVDEIINDEEYDDSEVKKYASIIRKRQGAFTYIGEVCLKVCSDDNRSSVIYIHKDERKGIAIIEILETEEESYTFLFKNNDKYDIVDQIIVKGKELFNDNYVAHEDVLRDLKESLQRASHPKTNDRRRTKRSRRPRFPRLQQQDQPSQQSQSSQSSQSSQQGQPSQQDRRSQQRQFSQQGQLIQQSQQDRRSQQRQFSQRDRRSRHRNKRSDSNAVVIRQHNMEISSTIDWNDDSYRAVRYDMILRPIFEKVYNFAVSFLAQKRVSPDEFELIFKQMAVIVARCNEIINIGNASYGVYRQVEDVTRLIQLWQQKTVEVLKKLSFHAAQMDQDDVHYSIVNLVSVIADKTSKLSERYLQVNKINQLAIQCKQLMEEFNIQLSNEDVDIGKQFRMLQ
jgi:hypothetical protein